MTWKLIEKVVDKTDNWRKYSDGHGNVIDIWKSAPNHWNSTINGSFLTRADSQGNATKHAKLYMKRHPKGYR